MLLMTHEEDDFLIRIITKNTILIRFTIVLMMLCLVLKAHCYIEHDDDVDCALNCRSLSSLSSHATYRAAYLAFELACRPSVRTI